MFCSDDKRRLWSSKPRNGNIRQQLLHCREQIKIWKFSQKSISNLINPNITGLEEIKNDINSVFYNLTNSATHQINQNQFTRYLGTLTRAAGVIVTTDLCFDKKKNGTTGDNGLFGASRVICSDYESRREIRIRCLLPEATLICDKYPHGAVSGQKIFIIPQDKLCKLRVCHDHEKLVKYFANYEITKNGHGLEISQAPEENEWRFTFKSIHNLPMSNTDGKRVTEIKHYVLFLGYVHHKSGHVFETQQKSRSIVITTNTKQNFDGWMTIFWEATFAKEKHEDRHPGTKRTLATVTWNRHPQSVKLDEFIQFLQERFQTSGNSASSETRNVRKFLEHEKGFIKEKLGFPSLGNGPDKRRLEWTTLVNKGYNFLNPTEPRNSRNPVSEKPKPKKPNAAKKLTPTKNNNPKNHDKPGLNTRESFTKWIFEIVRLLQDPDILYFWNNEWLQLCSYSEWEVKLKESNKGTCGLRFSETMYGAVSVIYRDANGDVSKREPFVQRTSTDTLTDYLRKREYLNNLYPNFNKDEWLPKQSADALTDKLVKKGYKGKCSEKITDNLLPCNVATTTGDQIEDEPMESDPIDSTNHAYISTVVGLMSDFEVSCCLGDDQDSDLQETFDDSTTYNEILGQLILNRNSDPLPELKALLVEEFDENCLN